MVKVQNLRSVKQLIINKKKIKESNKIFFYRNEQLVGHGFEMKPTEWYVHGAKNIGQVPSKI
jgi:hypothetical protein